MNALTLAPQPRLNLVFRCVQLYNDGIGVFPEIKEVQAWPHRRRALSTWNRACR